MAKAKTGDEQPDDGTTDAVVVREVAPDDASERAEKRARPARQAPSATTKADRKARWRRVRRWLLRGLAALLIGLVALASVVLFRTWRFESRQPTVSPAPPLAVDIAPAAQRLAESLRFQTISTEDGPAGPEVFAPLHQFLQTSFPRVHATLTREVIGESSLLYTWPGSDPQSRPVILAAHLDVVPIPPETLDKWTHLPFAGTIADGFIWGRGALDDKVAVLGVLEAVESLLGAGYAPRRTIYLGFGHDEEVGGRGAQAISATLAERGVRAEFVLDEGMIITRGVMPGLDAPLATVGIAEKGFVSLELLASADGGHSSVPPDRTAIGALSRAIARLEANPMAASLDGPIRYSLAYMGPEMPFVQRMAMANLWLLGGVIKSTFLAGKNTRALIRTTTAPTIVEAGTKDNVLPQQARAVVNFRILPGDTIESVIAHVRSVIADGQIAIRMTRGVEPSPVSNPESAAFKLLHRTIREVFSGAVVAPSLVVGGTDGRYYEPVVDDVYRFLPVIFREEDIARLHGDNERISVDGYGQLIRFYIQLLNNLQDL